METKTPVEEVNIKVEDGEKEDLKEKSPWCTRRVMINSAMLVVWIAVLEGLSFGLNRAFPDNVCYDDWISSPGSPPSVVFPIVWALLYLSLAICGWFLSLALKERQILYMFIVFWVQIILGFVWQPVYQKLCNIVAGLVLQVMFTVLTGVLIVRLWTLKLEILGVKTRYIGLIIVPYFLWLCYAIHLASYSIAANPDKI